MLFRYVKFSNVLVLLMALLISHGNIMPVLAGGDLPPGHRPIVVEFPVSFFIGAPCVNDGMGETIDLVGTLRISFFEVQDANNVIHHRLHESFINISGIGQSTNNTYFATMQTVSNTTIGESIGSTTFTTHTHLALTTREKSENVKFNFNYRVISYADGSFEYVTEHSMVTCQ